MKDYLDKSLFPDLFLTEEDRMVQRLVHDFVDKEIMPVRHLIDDDTDRKIVHKIRQGLVDLDLVKLFPEEYGGLGRMSMVRNCLINEELARGDLGIAVTYSCVYWGWAPAMIGDMKAVLERFVPDFCGNEVRICCYNATEPGGSHGGGGCDIENPVLHGRKLRTIARLEGEEWVINGAKMWASNSGDADLYCVPCTVDPELGDDGICLIYVPYPWSGLSRGKLENKAGVRADANCATFFDNVRVPKEWGIGPGGKAATIFHAQLLGSKSGAFNVGNLRGAFETVLEYTGARIVHDKPIRQHAQAAMILGRMASAILLGRYYYLTAAHMFDHPEIYGYPWEGYNAAIQNVTKSYIPRLCISAIEEAIPLLGSYGYTRDSHFEKYWRDSKIAHIWIGGEQLNTLNVARGFYDLEL